jgi:hypothetical protein
MAFVAGARGAVMAFIAGARGAVMAFVAGARGAVMAFVAGARGAVMDFVAGARGAVMAFVPHTRGAGAGADGRGVDSRVCPRASTRTAGTGAGARCDLGSKTVPWAKVTLLRSTGVVVDTTGGAGTDTGTGARTGKSELE